MMPTRVRIEKEDDAGIIALIPSCQTQSVGQDSVILHAEGRTGDIIIMPATTA
jgi:hypothetical protein